MMLGEDSEAADYWKKAGDQALANNIKGVIMMVCHPPTPTVINWLIGIDRALIGMLKAIACKSP